MYNPLKSGRESGLGGGTEESGGSSRGRQASTFKQRHYFLLFLMRKSSALSMLAPFLALIGITTHGLSTT